MKNLDANQAAKLSRTYLEPLYFAHIYLPGETLYLSNRTFKYNDHQYEALLLDLPALAQSIEKLGGYQNLSASLIFRNIRYRNYSAFIDWLNANPITRREMELFELYIDPGETFGSDVSTKLARLAICEIQGVTDESITYSLSSIMHYLDSKKLFTQINKTTWPNAAPEAIGKYANKIYGYLRNIPCHCIQTYAVSTLFMDMASTGETYIALSDVDNPISFPTTGVVQIGSEKIRYSAKESGYKRLTIQTRGYGGTTAVAHKRGSPCWLVESPAGTALNFKYLVADHVMYGVWFVYAGQAKIRIDSADYAINLNEGGKTTITFTERQIRKVLEIISGASSGAESNATTDPGSHAHYSPVTTMKYGIGGVLQWSGSWTHSGTEANMRDRSDLTYAYANHYGEINAAFSFHTYFSAWDGPPIKSISVCITHALGLSGTASAKLYSNAGGTNLIANLSSTGSTVTQKILQTAAPTTCPTDVYVVLNLGSLPGNASEFVFEIWLEIECDSTGQSPAYGVSSDVSTAVSTTVTVEGEDPEVIAPLIICDGNGYKDTPSGTYTGAPNSLIENPSDVRKHLLIAVLGRSWSEIGDSFVSARVAYANRIAGGYKFGMILSRLGIKPSEIFRALDEQSRSNMREDGGLFELVFNDAADPTSALTIDSKIYIGKPVFKQTRAEDIKNLIRACYDLDWSGTLENRKYGDFMKQTQRSDSASQTKYGELPLDLEYPAIQIDAMAVDVADWALLQQKDVVWCVELIANRKARILEKGDYFTLNDVFTSLNGLKWRVLDIQEIPYSQNFRIQALQYVAP